MPLRCINPEGQSIHSFDLLADDWQALLQENKKAQHLKMPCCNAAVVLKRSKLGTQFFAHKAKGMCATAPEREEHLILKQEAVLAARRNGWQANTEVSGRTPDGEEWRADMLAEKGKHKVAVEIQWSRQSNEETLTRQERYKKSGIRCLWLMRQTNFPISQELPAICIGGDLEKGFLALLPKHNGQNRHKPEEFHQTLEISNFLNSVFDRRLKFLSLTDSKIYGQVYVKKTYCFCRKQNAQIQKIEFAVHFPNTNFIVESKRSLHSLTDGAEKEITNLLCKVIPKECQFGPTKLFQYYEGSMLRQRCHNCDLNFDLVNGGDDIRSPKIKVADFVVKATSDWMTLFSDIWTDKWHINSKNDVL